MDNDCMECMLDCIKRSMPERRMRTSSDIPSKKRMRPRRVRFNLPNENEEPTVQHM